MRDLILIVGLASLATGCGTDPDEPDSVHYQFGLDAFAGDSTAERIRSYDCYTNGFFSVLTPVEPTGTVELSLSMVRSFSERRGDHQELTSADTVVHDAVLAYSGLGENTLSLTLTAGAYSVALPPATSTVGPSEHTGDWVCGPDFPLAHDSTLLVYGYDPAVEIPGHWRVQELLPIE